MDEKKLLDWQEANEERCFINVFTPIHEGCGDTIVMNVPQDDTVNLVALQKNLLAVVKDNSHITYEEIAASRQVIRKTVACHTATLKEVGFLKRINEDKNGY